MKDERSENGFSVDPAIDDVIASLVTPPARVDLRAAVLRRIEEADESRAAAPWFGANWRLATLAAAALIVVATAIVMWRNAVPEPASSGRTATVIRESVPASGPASPTEGPREPSTVDRVAVVPEAVRSAPPRVRRRATGDASRLENLHALPALELPPPLRPEAMTTDALQVQEVEPLAPIEIAPLQIEQIDVNRPGVPER